MGISSGLRSWETSANPGPVSARIAAANIPIGMKMAKRDDDRPTRLVYSTETGRIRDEPEEEQILGDGRVRVQLVKNGRGGKTVTCISGLPLKASELEVLGKQFKKRCGTGGSVKNGVIEIQGDFADLLVAELKKAGYDAKRSGG